MILILAPTTSSRVRKRAGPPQNSTDMKIPRVASNAGQPLADEDQMEIESGPPIATPEPAPLEPPGPQPERGTPSSQPPLRHGSPPAGQAAPGM